MSAIRLYYAPGACSLAPHILLREAGVDFEAVVATRITETGMTFLEDFHHINPKMRVPVISVGGDTITEVPAIATMIANLAPDRGLVGRTPLDSVRIYEWMNWTSGTMHGGAFSHLFRPLYYSNDPTAVDGIKAKAMDNIRNCFDYIEGKLVGVYAVGGALTAVDPFLFVCYRWGNEVGFEMKEEYPKYTALVANLVSRAAVKAALEAEGIQSTL